MQLLDPPGYWQKNYTAKLSCCEFSCFSRSWRQGEAKLNAIKIWNAKLIKVLTDRVLSEVALLAMGEPNELIQTYLKLVEYKDAAS